MTHLEGVTGEGVTGEAAAGDTSKLPRRATAGRTKELSMFDDMRKVDGWCDLSVIIAQQLLIDSERRRKRGYWIYVDRSRARPRFGMTGTGNKRLERHGCAARQEHMNTRVLPEDPPQTRQCARCLYFRVKDLATKFNV